MSTHFGCTCTFMFNTNVDLPSHLKIAINDHHTIEEFVFPFDLLLYQNTSKIQQTSFVLLRFELKSLQCPFKSSACINQTSASTSTVDADTKAPPPINQWITDSVQTSRYYKCCGFTKNQRH